jgi:hypothetical protein
MASSIRLSTAGASYRLTAMLSGSGAGFSMGLVLCLCGGLIACFAVLSAQMRQQALVVAAEPVAAVDPVVAADQAFNARYYPLVDCPRFGFGTLRQRLGLERGNWHRYMGPLPYLDPLPEDLPTGDPSPKTPLYPRTPAVAPAADAQGAVEVR